MAANIRFEDNIGLVHLQAKYGLRWAGNAGLSMDYEDWYQEASLAFVIAVDGFNPDAGIKFSAYYSKVAFSMFRQAIGRLTGVKNLNPAQRAEIEARTTENERRAAAALPPLESHRYGLRPVSFQELAGEDGMPFEEGLASEARTPEEILEAKQQWQARSAALSPLAQLVVEWLREPPPEVLRELASQLAHVNDAAMRGEPLRMARTGITLANVTELLRLIGDVPKEDMVSVQAELLNVVKEMERAEHD